MLIYGHLGVFGSATRSFEEINSVVSFVLCVFEYLKRTIQAKFSKIKKEFLTQARMLVQVLRSHVIQEKSKNSTKKVQAKRLKNGRFRWILRDTGPGISVDHATDHRPCRSIDFFSKYIFLHFSTEIPHQHPIYYTNTSLLH